MNLKIDYLTPLLQVFDMRRSLSFYRDTLGFEVISDSGDCDDSSWIWLQKDDCHLMLNDQYEPGQVPSECPTERMLWHEDTCIYFGCNDVDAVFEYLASKGLDIELPQVAGYGMKQLYLSDPDGYSICFQHPVENVQN